MTTQPSSQLPGRRRAPGLRWAAAILAAALVALAALPSMMPPARAAEQLTTTTMLGDYATPLVGAPDANGVRHIDTPATIAKLTAAQVNTYAYLIYSAPLYGTGTAAQITQAQWNDLPNFATAAARTGMNVLVYLVPPTESTETGYKPYGWDYKAWAQAIATLAQSHTNIREIVMDDFAQNTVEGGSTRPVRFTPAYVADMMNSARGIASWLKFRPTIYYPDAVGVRAVLPAYRSVVDGIVYPYRASVGGKFNTTDASLATSWGRVVGAVSKCHGGNACFQVAFPKNTASTTGAYGSLHQPITVTAGATKTLTFWQTDDYNSVTAGYHYLQALVDNTVVWQADVAASSDGRWHKQTVNVTSALAGKQSATLTFRVRDARGVSNFPVTGWFDDVSGSGFSVRDGGFEQGGVWTSSVSSRIFTVMRVPTLNYAFMTYATNFSYETEPVSTTYVDSVVGQALAMVNEGVVDGSLIYSLNLTGLVDGRSDPATYNVVQSRYGSF